MISGYLLLPRQELLGAFYTKRVMEVLVPQSERDPCLGVRVSPVAMAGPTFGLYLIHVIVMEVLSRWRPFVQINAEMGNAVWTIPFVSLLVFFIPLFIVRIIQKYQ